MGERERIGALTGSLEVLFQLKGVGVVQTDLKTGRLLRANRAFCEMVGYNETELQGLTHEELTHPDDRARDAANFAAFQRGELTGSDAVTRVLRRDGVTVWLELHVSILEKAGQLYNVAVAHDVTERKRAEKAQQAADARALLALEVGELGTWSWDPGRDEVIADARCREICGLEPQVALTLTDVAERVHPEDWQRVETALGTALQPEGAHHYAEEFRFVHPDGAVRWVVSRGNAYVDEVGGIGLLGTVLDVTERKEAEAQLRYQLELTQTITDNTQLCLLMMDADGRTTFANAVTERVTGFKPEELIGHVLHDKIHHTYPDGRPFPIDECPLDRALPIRKSVVGYEDVFVHKDGHFYPVRCNARPIFKAGRPVGTVIEVQDVSEEKRAEVERKAAEGELERQKRLLEALTESVLDGILIVSNEGRTLHFNQHFLDIWNFPPEVIKARSDEVALAWAAGQTTDPLAFLARVAAVYEQPEVKVREEMELKDGRVYERFGAPIHDVATRLGWVWTFRDITERKRAEAEREKLLTALSELNTTLEQRVEERTEALRQSERRFTQAFSAGPIAACITSLGEEAFLEVNGAFARLTGYSHSEVAGKTYEQLGIWLSPEDHTKLEQARDAEGNVRNLELKLRTKSGEVKDILLSAGVIDLHGEQGHLTMFYDITRRKEAEAERELLRQAMDNAEESVVVTTADLELPGPQITYVNAAFTAMTGYQPKEVIGQTPRMFQGPETDRAVLRRMRRRLKVGRSFQGETVNYRKDGSTYILAWNVAPIYGSQGHITHWVSTQHDVTERRALERELLDISAREQRRVAGDLHDSVQQQLVGTAMHAKRLAIVAKVSAPSLATELEQLYTSVQDSVKSVRAVLSGITPVQETENGLLVALESMCHRVTSMFGTPCSFSFEQPLLIRDFERATQLYYIAQEAAINAAKHAEASRIDVRLAGTEGSYTLSITDDGKGVSRETLQPQNGMGLGLMVYRAKLIGAEFDLSSAPGEGTMVTCLFDT